MRKVEHPEYFGAECDEELQEILCVITSESSHCFKISCVHKNNMPLEGQRGQLLAYNSKRSDADRLA